MAPLNPAIMAMLSSLGGGPGGPGGPGAPGMPGMAPGGMPGGAPPPGMDPGGLGALGQEGMDALDMLVNKEPNGELGVERVRKGLEVAHQIILACLPIVGVQNMDMAKQLHVLGRQLADTRMNLSKENEAGLPPEAMISGISGTGIPGGGY